MSAELACVCLVLCTLAFPEGAPGRVAQEASHAPPHDEPRGVRLRAKDYYDRFLRDRLEPEHTGKFLALDVETGEYEMTADQMAAIDRARARMPDKIFYILRVGYRAANHIGARVSET